MYSTLICQNFGALKSLLPHFSSLKYRDYALKLTFKILLI